MRASTPSLPTDTNGYKRNTRRNHRIVQAYSQSDLDRPIQASWVFDPARYVLHPGEIATILTERPFVGRTFQTPWTFW